MTIAVGECMDPERRAWAHFDALDEIAPCTDSGATMTKGVREYLLRVLETDGKQVYESLCDKAARAWNVPVATVHIPGYSPEWRHDR